MIDTLGPYILVLILTNWMNGSGGITAVEMTDFDSCQAALTQLSVDRNITGYCIAKELAKGE